MSFVSTLSANVAAGFLPEQVCCEKMSFFVPDNCLTPLDRSQQLLLLAALQPLRLDWDQPQRDRRGYQAWLYMAKWRADEMMVAVVLDQQARLIKLRAMQNECAGMCGPTLVFAAFAPSLAPRPALRAGFTPPKII